MASIDKEGKGLKFLEFFIDFGYFGFHLFSALLLGLLWLFIFYLTWPHGIWSLVFATAADCFSIHLYESFHGFTQLAIIGETGSTLGMNMMITIGVIGLLLVMNTTCKILIVKANRKLLSMGLAALSMFAMAALVGAGYFILYPRNIIFGVEWALSKISVTLFVASLFVRRENVIY